jgi:predicted nucleic acid-binding protein
MNTSIIADSSGLVSLVSNTDRNHPIAMQLSEELKNTAGSIIVPGDVFSETLNVIGRKIEHAVAVTVGQELISCETYLVMEASEKIRRWAFELFRVQPESVSFTDCVVMAFADQFATKNIFGFDEVFKKNGYKRLGFERN